MGRFHGQAEEAGMVAAGACVAHVLLSSQVVLKLCGTYLYGLMKLTSVMTPWSANSLPTSPMRLMFSSLHKQWAWPGDLNVFDLSHCA